MIFLRTQKEDLSRIAFFVVHLAVSFPYPSRLSSFFIPKRNAISAASALFLLNWVYRKKKYTASKRSNKTPRCFPLQGTTQVRVSRIHRWASRKRGKKSAGLWHANNNDARPRSRMRLADAEKGRRGGDKSHGNVITLFLAGRVHAPRRGTNGRRQQWFDESLRLRSLMRQKQRRQFDYYLRICCTSRDTTATLKAARKS